MELLYFGPIDISSLEEDYDVKIQLNGKTIRLDLNFEQTQMSKQQLAIIERFLENISSFNEQNATFIENDFNDEEGQVKEYLSFHIEELGDDFLGQLKIDKDASDKEQQLLGKLELVRVGLYPDGKYGTEYFAVFDYTLNRDLSDELIVVKTDNEGHLDHIAWES